MDVPNNWSARRLWRGRTCFGLLLCKITVQFSLMLYMCSQGEWGVGVFACVCVCACVCLSACSQANIKTLSRNGLCVFVCTFAWLSRRERATE